MIVTKLIFIKINIILMNQNGKQVICIDEKLRKVAGLFLQHLKCIMNFPIIITQVFKTVKIVN